jgi:probable O-glycosylation ligase (exosortase A-associated)
MNPHRLTWGFMHDFPVVLVTALVTLVGMLISKEPKRMIWSREVIVLLLLIAWIGITTTQAFFTDLAWLQYEKVVKIQILTFMTLLLLTSRQRVHIFVWILALSLGFYGIKGGIFTIVNGGAYRVQGPTGSFIAGNNELALALVMTIPLMRYLYLQERRKWLKLGLAAAILLTAIAAIGSQSRGALVAITITGVIFWFKSRKKFVTALFIAAAIGAVVAIMPPQWYERMATIQTFEQDNSALGRINAWWTAFNVAQDRITGGGFEMFRWSVFKQYAPEPGRVHDAHSIYFEILGEHGFVGLALFLTLLGFTWLKCSGIIRATKKKPELMWARDLAAMIQVSMVGYMTAGAFLGLAYFNYIYHLVALVIVTAHLVAQSQSDHAPEQRHLAIRVTG